MLLIECRASFQCTVHQGDGHQKSGQMFQTFRLSRRGLFTRKAANSKITCRKFFLSLIDYLRGDTQGSENMPEDPLREQKTLQQPTKRRKCQQKDCQNLSSSYCKVCRKKTCGLCSKGEKLILVVCKNCDTLTP